MVVPEIKLLHVALQVLRADAMERANNTAIEYGEVPFHGVRLRVAANVFPDTVVNSVMTFEERREQAVLALAIGHKASAGAMQLCVKDRAQRSGVYRRHMRGAYLPTPFDQREHHLFADTANMRLV